MQLFRKVLTRLRQREGGARREQQEQQEEEAAVTRASGDEPCLVLPHAPVVHVVNHYRRRGPHEMPLPAWLVQLDHQLVLSGNPSLMPTTPLERRTRRRVLAELMTGQQEQADHRAVTALAILENEQRQLHTAPEEPQQQQQQQQGEEEGQREGEVLLAWSLFEDIPDETACILENMTKKGGFCQICLESCDTLTAAFLHQGTPAGGSCEAEACIGCLSAFFTEKVESGYFGACPQMKCFACSSIVRRPVWSLVVEGRNIVTRRGREGEEGQAGEQVQTTTTSVVDLFNQRATALLSIQCGTCHTRGHIMVEHQPGETAGASKRRAQDAIKEEIRGALLTAGKEEEDAEREWAQLFAALEAFEHGQITQVEAFAAVSTVLRAVVKNEGEKDEEEETRVEDYTPERHDQVSSFMDKVLLCVEDEERRATLQTRFLRLHPRCLSLCCRREHCFVCKSAGFHKGQTCDVVRQQMYSRQEQEPVVTCPGCGVFVVKGDGCNALSCVCGTYFDWGERVRDRLQGIQRAVVERHGVAEFGRLAARLLYMEVCRDSQAITSFTITSVDDATATTTTTTINAQQDRVACLSAAIAPVPFDDDFREVVQLFVREAQSRGGEESRAALRRGRAMLWEEIHGTTGVSASSPFASLSVRSVTAVGTDGKADASSSAAACLAAAASLCGPLAATVHQLAGPGMSGQRPVAESRAGKQQQSADDELARAWKAENEGVYLRYRKGVEQARAAYLEAMLLGGGGGGAGGGGDDGAYQSGSSREEDAPTVDTLPLHRRREKVARRVVEVLHGRSPTDNDAALEGAIDDWLAYPRNRRVYDQQLQMYEDSAAQREADAFLALYGGGGLPWAAQRKGAKTAAVDKAVTVETARRRVMYFEEHPSELCREQRSLFKAFAGVYMPDYTLSEELEAEEFLQALMGMDCLWEEDEEERREERREERMEERRQQEEENGGQQQQQQAVQPRRGGWGLDEWEGAAWEVPQEGVEAAGWEVPQEGVVEEAVEQEGQGALVRLFGAQSREAAVADMQARLAEGRGREDEGGRGRRPCGAHQT